MLLSTLLIIAGVLGGLLLAVEMAIEKEYRDASEEYRKLLESVDSPERERKDDGWNPEF